MSDDLQDFLRRAAQRRKAKAQQAPPPPQRQKPQYTNARTERIVRDVHDEAITQQAADNSYASRIEQIEQRRKEAARAEAEAAKQMAKVKQKKRTPSQTPMHFTGDPAEDIRRLLCRPEGLRQAMLVREILDRRW